MQRTAPPQTENYRGAPADFSCNSLGQISLVRVQDGVATLSGFVWDPQDIYRASELAAHLPGVNDVIDEIELKRQEYR